jgi:hypothetical protein
VGAETKLRNRLLREDSGVAPTTRREQEENHKHRTKRGTKMRDTEFWSVYDVKLNSYLRSIVVVFLGQCPRENHMRILQMVFSSSEIRWHQPNKIRLPTVDRDQRLIRWYLAHTFWRIRGRDWVTKKGERASEKVLAILPVYQAIMWGGLQMCPLHGQSVVPHPGSIGRGTVCSTSESHEGEPLVCEFLAK